MRFSCPKRLIFFALTSVFLFRISWISRAADDTDDEITESRQLEEVVVTGTRTEKKLVDAPVRTEVVTEEEIKKMHAKDLKEALEDVPGLVIKETEKNGYSVWMQGFDSDRVLILLNGRRLPATTGSTVDLTQISTADVERIEIIKGSVSALYGSDAMGGVINVITKTPTEPYSITLETDAGTFGDKNLEDKIIGTEHFLGEFMMNRGHWSVSLLSDVRLFEGFDNDKSEPSTDGDKGHRWNLNGNIAYTTDAGAEFYINSGYYKEKKSLFYSTFTPGVGDVLWERREDGDLLNLALGSDVPLGGGSRIQSAVAYERFDDVSILDIPDSPQLEQRRHAVITYSMAESQWDKPIGEKHLVTLGGIVGRQTLRQNQVQEDVNDTIFVEEIKPDAHQDNYEVYLQDDIFYNSWLELLPGLRYQYDTGFGSFLAPKINLMIIPADNVRVRLGYGRGYRVPNLKERYYFFDHTALGYIVLGNPDLQPEKSNSFQVGADGWWNSFNWDVNLFYNIVTDLIDVVLDQELSDEMGLQVFQYTNIKNATLWGGEIAASYWFLRYFNLKAGYTYLWAKDTDLDKWLPNRPKNQIKGGLDVAGVYPGNVSSLRVVYQSSEYVDEENTITSPAWTTVDIKLNQNIGERWTVFAGVDNVFDVHRSPSQVDDLRPVIGRYIYAGIRTTFNIGNKQPGNKQ